MRDKDLHEDAASIAKFICGAFAGIGIALAVMIAIGYFLITGLAVGCYAILIEIERGRK